jgi:hypothetical protein
MVGRNLMETIHKQFFEHTKTGLPTTGPRQKWITMATESPDRAGDVMVLAGMDSTNFLKNPQFIWQHGMSGAEINTIGKILDLQVIGGVLLALAEFATPEVSPLAEEVYQMCVAGLLPANSIGFRPIEFSQNDSGGHTFLKWELIECSKVELPMNPEAIDKSLIRKNHIELDETQMVTKSGRAISTERAKKLAEHAKNLKAAAKEIEDMLDDAAPKDKEETPYKSTVSTRRLKNRALLKSKQYQHE